MFKNKIKECDESTLKKSVASIVEGVEDTACLGGGSLSATYTIVLLG